MIKPESLWALFKDCDNSSYLGNICRALGGQNIHLDYGQKQLVNLIMQDSGLMDERIEARRKAWRERDKKRRSNQADKGDESIE